MEIHISFYFSGQPPAEADLNLLETARRCELYGTKMHPAKVNTISNEHHSFSEKFKLFIHFFDLRWYISILLGPRRSSTESCGCPYGGISLPKLHKNQYILMGQNKKTKLQAKKIPDKTTSRRICKYSFSLHVLNPPKLRNNIRKYRKRPTKKSQGQLLFTTTLTCME